MSTLANARQWKPWEQHPSNPGILNRDRFVPQGVLGNVWRHFLIFRSGDRGVLASSGSQARDTAKHPTVNRTMAKMPVVPKSNNLNLKDSQVC